MAQIIQGNFPLSCSNFNQPAGLVRPLEIITNTGAMPGFTGLARVADSFEFLNGLKDCGVNTLRVGERNKRFRTPNCLCFLAPGSGGAGLRYRPSTGRVSYSGLTVCGSVWTCPVCGQRICQQRANDLTRLINVHTGRGGDVYLLTFTAPHGPGEDLRRRMDLFQRAYNGAMKSMAVMTFKRSAGFIGSVTSKEVTHGVNGFHDHYHVLWFTTKPIYRDVLEFVVFEQWRNYALKRGLGEPHPDAFDVRMGSAAGEYVSKLGWNIATEVALSGEKRGREGSRHPFDLFLDWSRGEFPAGLGLFLQYAAATWGRRYMTSYKPLARKLGVDLEELTDAQLAEQAEADSVLVFVLGWDLWRKVLRHKVRAQVLRLFELEIAGHGDFERAGSALVDFVLSLGE